MAKKKKSEEAPVSKEKATKTEALIDDFTSSLTDSVSLDSKVADTILGLEALRKPAKAQALLKGLPRSFDQEVAGLLGVNVEKHFPFSFIVVGPFEYMKIKEWAESGKLNRGIQIQVAYSRWKGLKEQFPDLSSTKLGADEVTDTSSTTEYTATQTLTEEMASLELESMEDLKNGNSENKEKIFDPETKSNELKIEKQNLIKELKLETEQVKTVAPQSASFQGKVEVQSSKALEANPESISSKLWWLVGVLACVVAFLVIQKKSVKKTNESSYLSTQSGTTEAPTRTVEYPEKLRPMSVKALYEDFEKAHLTALEKVAFRYDFTKSDLNEADIQTLKSMSDPAASSLEGQKLATNMLASVYLDNDKVDDALALLNTLVANGDTDANTFLNLSLGYFLKEDYSLAKDRVGSALRLCQPANCWLAYALWGMIEVARGHYEDGQRQFQQALSRSSQNPLPYGLWLHSLLKNPQAFKLRSPTVLKNALWSDPDRWVDAPLRAPLAGRTFTRLAIEGLSEGAKESNSLGAQAHLRAFLLEMTEGLRNGEDWISKYDPSSLLQHEDYNSQVLAAYILSMQGKLPEASDVIGRVTMLLSSDQVTGSWPWSLAGDIQFQRGQMDLAVVAYQNALSRSQLNSPAVLGMALALREKSSFSASLQKFTEAEGQDPLFIPAVLRMSRFDWHKAKKNLNF